MIDIIELAKECGAIPKKTGRNFPTVYPLAEHELTAFANAIVEECAKVAFDKAQSYQEQYQTSKRGDRYYEGMADGCDECSTSISELKIKG